MFHNAVLYTKVSADNSLHLGTVNERRALVIERQGRRRPRGKSASVDVFGLLVAAALSPAPRAAGKAQQMVNLAAPS
jgi:hypothetical protein